MHAPDRPQIVLDAAGVLGDKVADTLWSRGWMLADASTDSRAPLQWLWPPTCGAEDEESPWIAPTRITQRDGSWRVDFGATDAVRPARSETYIDADPDALQSQLDRIEIWPMPLAEAQRLRKTRIVEVTRLKTWKRLSRNFHWTEPYLGRLAKLQERQRREHQRTRRRAFDPGDMPLRQAYMAALETHIEASAWLSALRTARAGGKGWSIKGREK